MAIFDYYKRCIDYVWCLVQVSAKKLRASTFVQLNHEIPVEWQVLLAHTIRAMRLNLECEKYIH